jgi:ribosomal protein S27E
MGKMKEIYMAMLEEEMYNSNLVQIPEEPSTTDILCPNCMKKKLMFHTITDVKCELGCGQEFVLVDAQTVRFK